MLLLLIGFFILFISFLILKFLELIPSRFNKLNNFAFSRIGFDLFVIVFLGVLNHLNAPEGSFFSFNGSEFGALTALSIVLTSFHLTYLITQQVYSFQGVRYAQFRSLPISQTFQLGLLLLASFYFYFFVNYIFSLL